MIVDEFRDSIDIYNEMLEEGRHPLQLLNLVDKRLADISNHIAICNRVIGEQRAYAQNALLPGSRKRHIEKAEQAGQTLDTVIDVQRDMFEFRAKVLSRVEKEFDSLSR